MSDVTMGGIIALVPIILYLIFRFFFAQSFINGYLRGKKSVMDGYYEYDEYYPDDKYPVVYEHSRDDEIKSFKDVVILRRADTFGEFVRKLLRLSVGPQSIPNQILRTLVTFPLMVYIVVFCVAEMWNLNFLHWFYIFLIAGSIGLLLFEALSELLSMRFFNITRDVASLLLSVMVSAIILSFAGVFTPIHLINPEEMRFSILVIAIVGVLVIFIDWMQPGFRILFLPRDYIFAILIIAAITIVVLFGFLGYGESNTTVSKSSTAVWTSKIEQSKKVSSSTPTGDSVCADTFLKETSNSITVSPKKNCWSDYIKIPANVSTYRTNSNFCFSVWVPASTGNYYVESKKGNLFSCEDLLRDGMSVKGRAFRVRSSSPENSVMFSW